MIHLEFVIVVVVTVLKYFNSYMYIYFIKTFFTAKVDFSTTHYIKDMRKCLTSSKTFRYTRRILVFDVTIMLSHATANVIIFSHYRNVMDKKENKIVNYHFYIFFKNVRIKRSLCLL